jgi:alpha-beta hydrolase superfamily lysophospholipase
MNEATVVASVIVCAIALGAYAWTRRFARNFLRVKGRRSSKSPADAGLTATAIEVPRDGGALRGWFIRGGDGPRPTVIIAHGWQSHAADMLAYAAPMASAGYHVVLFDTMGHGESDHAEFASVRHFTEDLLAVWRWTSAQRDASPGIVLSGHSLGGTAAILATAEAEREGMAPRGIMTFGSPSDPIEVTQEWLASKGYPAALLMRAVYGFWRTIIVWDRDRIRPLLRMHSLRVPILIVHGSADKQIPVLHAHRLAEAGRETRLEILEGADHWTVPKHPRFEPVVTEFLGSVFPAVRR